ncbi:hypothetical protein [Mangrovicoccus ximenensis]|nr:hypothetical protein [Mangrovicoccus ximenensis]
MTGTAVTLPERACTRAQSSKKGATGFTLPLASLKAIRSGVPTVSVMGG